MVSLNNSNGMVNLIANLIYLIAVVLAIIWAVSYFGYNAGGGIHLLLLIAIAAAYLSIWKENVFQKF